MKLCNLFCIVLLLIVGFVSQGCSVVMAIHGADNPDQLVLRRGALRYEVEREYGKPYRWHLSEMRATYHFTTGEDGSPGRAIAHAAGDFLTFGLWEVVGTPIEMLQTHEKWMVDVWYSREDRVIRYNSPRRR